MTREVTLIAGEPQEFFEVADFFRLLAADAPIKVEFYQQGREVSEAVNVSKGYAEKFDRGTFDRVRLMSDTTQDVQFVTRLGNVVLYDAAPIGDTSIVSSVPLALDSATLAALLLQHRPELPTNHWNNVSSAAAGTPLTIFNAAANPNGAIIWTAESLDIFASLTLQSFIAKATAPSTINDGEVIAMSVSAAPGASNTFFHSRLAIPQRIAGGLGLYFISGGGGSASAARHCRYTLL